MTAHRKSAGALASWHPVGATLPSAALMGALGVGLIFVGLDTGVGPGALAFVAALFLLWQTVLGLPGPAFGKAIAVPFGLIGAALVWAVLASLAASGLAPDLAGHGAVGFLGGALTLLLAVIVGARRASIGPALEALVVAGSLDIAIGLLLRASRDYDLFPIWELWRSNRFLGTTNNANVTATICGTVAVLALHRLLAAGRRGGGLATPKNVGLILALVGSIAALGYTASRAGLALTGVGLAIVIAHHRQRLGLTMGIGIVALSLVTGRVLERFGFLERGIADRQDIWAHFGAIALQSPVFGYGLGSFPMINAAYPGDSITAGKLWTVNSPHNLVLHLMLDAGIPYLLLLSAAAILILWPIAIALGRRRIGGDVIAALAAAAIPTGSSMVDIAVEMPAIAAMVLILVGLCWGQALRALDFRLFGHRPASPARHERTISR